MRMKLSAVSEDRHPRLLVTNVKDGVRITREGARAPMTTRLPPSKHGVTGILFWPGRLGVICLESHDDLPSAQRPVGAAAQ